MTNSSSNCLDQVGQDITLAVDTVTTSVVSVWKTILALIICAAVASIIVLSALKKVNFVAVFCIILLTIIFFMLLTSMGANILGISLPFASFPNPSHLGLDGVSPTNYIAGRSLQ